MLTTDFAGLPDSARLYVFGTSRTLTEPETARLLAEVDGFLAEWQAHKADVAAARDWRHDRFLLVAADEEVTALSGCSIDALIRRIKDLEGSMAVGLLDSGSMVFYRRPDGIARLPREAFAALVAAGEAGPGTIVFDNTVTTVGQLRAGAWELPFERSWHARAFPLPATARTGA